MLNFCVGFLENWRHKRIILRLTYLYTSCSYFGFCCLLARLRAPACYPEGNWGRNQLYKYLFFFSSNEETEVTTTKDWYHYSQQTPDHELFERLKVKFGFSEKATKFEKIFIVLLTRPSCSVYFLKSRRRFFKTNVVKSN